MSEVLVLHGSPGSGKSTLSGAIAELLRVADQAHAVIDLDEISLIFPSPGRDFALRNLQAIWPNYAAVPGLRLIVPSVIADEAELAAFRAAVPCDRFLVCELTASRRVLDERVMAREPNEFWRDRLRYFLDLFGARTDLDRIRDFEVSTAGRSIDDAAREVISKAGWSR
jgi:ABC-type dipeptide/oligopeptide/nickel transport system ATPase subunit